MCLSLVSPERTTRERYLSCKYFAGDCDPQKQQWRRVKQWEVLLLSWLTPQSTWEAHVTRTSGLPTWCEKAGSVYPSVCILRWSENIPWGFNSPALPGSIGEDADGHLPCPKPRWKQRSLSMEARRARRLPSCAAGWTHARAAYHRGDQSRRQVWPQGSKEVCNRYPIRDVCSLRRRVLLWSGW